MNYNEIWGIAFSRISKYFSTQEDVESFGPRSFKFKDAVIELEELPDKALGSMRVCQTRVTISGEDAEEIHRRFYLQFLSAVG